MTAETAYTNIRTGVANYIIANVDWVTALETDIFDYTPDDIAIVFGHLPSIVVDFDPRTVNEWTDMGQGALEGVPVMIQVFTEIEPDDTTHGRDASQDVADKLSEAGVKCLLNFAPVSLNVPEDVKVKDVDLSRELETLSYFLAK